jgi:hypothetical protein
MEGCSGFWLQGAFSHIGAFGPDPESHRKFFKSLIVVRHNAVCVSEDSSVSTGSVVTGLRRTSWT